MPAACAFPSLPLLFRLAPLLEQETSYFAQSARIFSLCITLSSMAQLYRCENRCSRTNIRNCSKTGSTINSCCPFVAFGLFTSTLFGSINMSFHRLCASFDVAVCEGFENCSVLLENCRKIILILLRFSAFVLEEVLER